jgi:hypothetical protein
MPPPEAQSPARKPRVKLFAKGNVDVRDSLVCSRVNGEVLWNGINVALEELGYDAIARVEHEVGPPLEQLLGCPRPVPTELASRALPLDPYSVGVQYGTRLFDADADAVVLSIQPSVCMTLCRHRREGYLLYAGTEHSAENRAWIRAHFEPLPPCPPDAAMDHVERIVARLRERRERPILVYNMSFVVPAERIHSHVGTIDSLSTRIRRFNLALIELARQIPISIIDVDDVVARAGASRVKLDTVHYNAAGYRAIAETVADVLADHGLFRRVE